MLSSTLRALSLLQGLRTFNLSLFFICFRGIQVIKWLPSPSTPQTRLSSLSKKKVLQSFRILPRQKSSKIDPASCLTLPDLSIKFLYHSIVFVHGVLGKQPCWTSESGIFWPQKLLAPKLPDARILSYRYTEKIRFSEGKTDASVACLVYGRLIDDLAEHRKEKASVGTILS